MVDDGHVMAMRHRSGPDDYHSTAGYGEYRWGPAPEPTATNARRTGTPFYGADSQEPAVDASTGSSTEEVGGYCSCASVSSAR